MPQTLTKRELVNQIYAERKGEITQGDILEIVQRSIDIISDTLAKGDRVVLRNFGTLLVKEVKAKVGRNPKAPDKDVPIPARMVVKFKVGKELKERVANQ
ncbi:MAG: HU family DNA-binding protein [Akkermansia sp.]